MTLKERIALLVELGDYLLHWDDEPEAQALAHRAFLENKWFTTDNISAAVRSIATRMLTREALEQWVSRYHIPDRLHPELNIGIVMAGNIPLVGFHDWLCVFISGQRAKVKLSEKDKLLLPFLVNLMGKWQHESLEYTFFTAENEPLRDFDAVIATGSNNTARYFEQYFAKYPHIIRRNRNAVAILDGSETTADFLALGHDIFSYFGLGCRNVSKLYVPQGYHFDALLETLHEYRELANHDKYRNNFDYNTTLWLLNNQPYLNNGCLILKEDAALASRIASVHYEYYQDADALARDLLQRSEEIQCVVGRLQLPGISTVFFGQSQSPALSDYPDGVDVMAWLSTLHQA